MTTAVEQYYKVGEAAKLLSTSRWTIGRWIADGTLPAVDINPSSTGRAEFRIAETDLQTLIERLKVNTVRRSRRKSTPADSSAGVEPSADKSAKVVAKGNRRLSGHVIPKPKKSYL